MEYEDKQDTKNNLNEEENLIVLQLRNLSIGLGEESCIGFTQENSMENSLQELSLLIYVVTFVKIVNGGLYFIFPFHFYFTLLFFSFSLFYF